MITKKAIDLKEGDLVEGYLVLSDAGIMGGHGPSNEPVQFVGAQVMWKDGGLDVRLWDKERGLNEETVEVVEEGVTLEEYTDRLNSR